MSVQRRCDYTKAVDQQWYLTLGDNEHDYEDHECTVYGPFAALETAEEYCQNNFSNPGGSDTDDSGTAPVPVGAVHPYAGKRAVITQERFRYGRRLR